MKKFCVFLFIIPFLSLAEEKKWSVNELKSIVIHSKGLKLKFQEKKSDFYHLTWKGDFSFKNKDGKLKVESQDFQSKKSWSDFKTKAEITFSGPSLPVEVFASVSDISFFNWKSPVFISSFKSEIRLIKTKADWNISLYEGQINIKNHKGSLKLKSFKSFLSLFGSQGNFDFQVNEGRLKVKKSQGRLVFVGNKLNVQVSYFNGDIEGFTQSGEFRASVKPGNMDIQTGEAPIRVYFMGQGAYVNAYTEGYIYAPKYFYKKFEGKSMTVSGRIRSDIKKGSAKLKSESGKIYIN